MASSVSCNYCGSPNLATAKYCSDCGRPLQVMAYVPQSATPPPAVNATGRLPRSHILKQRYKVLDLLGQGGMGAVYKAEDQLFGNRLVAIKELSTSSLQSAKEISEATGLFEQEGKLLANLTHPNLPRIYDYFTDAGRWYLVMDFIEGQTLEDHLLKKGGKLPVAETLDTGIKLCAVLDYLHTRQPPIIFRDLKPANIMLTSNGNVYLIDFGIARLFKPGQIKDTQAFGTQGYIPPEQHGREQTTARADIYSLGATMHQLLTGDDPSNHPFNFAPLQWQGRPGLSSLEQLIFQMLELKKENRPASIAEVKQRLQDIASQLANIQVPQPVGSPAKGPSHNAQVQPATIAPPIVVPPPVKKVSLPPVGTTITTYTEHTDEVRAIALSPDGQHAVSASDDVQVWEIANGKKLFTYANPSPLVYAVAWAPDGWYIASGHFDRTVQVWDASTGNIFATYRKHTDRVRAVAWSHDGKYVASGGDDNTVCVWSFNASNCITIYRGHNDSVFAVAWSPDGKLIASSSDDNTVQVWNAITGKPVTIYRGHKGYVRTLAWSPDGKNIISGSWDKTVQVWNPLNGQTINTYRGHTRMVNAVAWFPDSKRVISGGKDKEVQIWDIATMDKLFTYSGHTDTVNALACSKNGHFVASASADKTVQFWSAG